MSNVQIAKALCCGMCGAPINRKKDVCDYCKTPWYIGPELPEQYRDQDVFYNSVSTISNYNISSACDQYGNSVWDDGFRTWKTHE